MYNLAFEVNGAVMTAAQGWRVLMSWASLLGISMLAASPQLTPFELYNCFAEENEKESIDMEDIERSPGRKVDHFLNEWVMLSRSKVLVARGEIFATRDEVLALLKTDDPGTNP